MDELTQSRTASFLTMLLGVWIAISPIFISMTGGLLASVIVVGIIIGLAGLTQLFATRNTIPSWVVGLSAIYLFIAAFSYGASNGAEWNAALCAIGAFILAMWDGSEISAFNRHHPVTG